MKPVYVIRAPTRVIRRVQALSAHAFAELRLSPRSDAPVANGHLWAPGAPAPFSEHSDKVADAAG